VNEYWLGAGTALWLGFLTSISPCPLTTNIAAVSFIGKSVGNTRAVLLSGLAFTLGKIAAFVGLTLLLVKSVLSIPGAAGFLQQNLNLALGPLLLVTGVILLDVIPLRLPSLDLMGGAGGKLQALAGKGSILGSALLGLVFSLAFCPVSAALYFGSLLPLALRQEAPGFYSVVFAVGTALPVLAFALLLAFAAHMVGAAFSKVRVFELWARRITGALFIIAGVHHILVYSFGIVLW
jgi:cytochrome c-type biogenesis protein